MAQEKSSATINVVVIVPTSFLILGIELIVPVGFRELKKKHPPTDPTGATVAWEKSSATISIVEIVPISLILPVRFREFI